MCRCATFGFLVAGRVIAFLVVRTLRSLAHRSIVAPTEIIALGEHAKREVQAVVDALALITRVDPQRAVRVRRQIRTVAIVRFPWPAELGLVAFHWSGQDVCFLDYRFVANESTETVALVIVHEAAHARIDRARVGLGFHNRARREALCLREETWFAAKLPNSDLLLPHLEERRRAYLGQDGGHTGF